MLTTPARAALRTPDSSDELRPSDAQPAGVYTDEPADASAAAAGSELLSVTDLCAAPSASSTTSAALQDPLSGPRSGSNPHKRDHASASAHDSDSSALTGTNYIPYTGRIPQVGSVPGYNPPVSSDRASVQGPLLLTGPGPVDALDDSRPPEAAVPPLRDEVSFGGHLGDTRMSGALSCSDRARPEAVSIPPGTSVDPSADASGDAHGALAAVRVLSRHDAPILPEAVAAHPSGTSYCPGRVASRESASFPAGTVKGDRDHAAPDACASSLAFSTSRSCDVPEGYNQAPVSDGPSVALPPSRSSVTGADLPPSRLPPDRQALDAPGSVPAPSSAPPSRRSLEHDLSAAAPAPDRSEFSSRVALSSSLDEGEKAAMLDEVDHHRHLSTEAMAKCRKLSLENAALSEQLRLASARPVVTSDAPSFAPCRTSTSSRHRPGRAGAELGGQLLDLEESRKSRRASAGPYATSSSRARLPSSPGPRRSSPPYRRPDSPPRPSPSRNPPSNSGGGPDSDDDPPLPGAGALALVPRRPPSDPPPPADDTLVFSASSPALSVQPVWYCTVHSSAGRAMTDAPAAWANALAISPRTPAMLKARHAQQPEIEGVTNLFALMARSPGMVASTYPRLLQRLVDHYVSFSFLNGFDVGTPALNAEAFRFFADACSATSCPSRVATCFLECCSSYSSSLDAVPSGSPSHSEYLIRYCLSSIILELSPPFTAMLEITFNNASKLVEGESLLEYMEKVRKAASESSMSDAMVRSKVVSVVQEASSHLRANAPVVNEASNRISEMMATGQSIPAFLSSIHAVAGIGGVLGQPLIRPATSTTSLVSPVGGFIAAAPAPPVTPVSAAPPPGPAFYSPSGAVGAAPPTTPPGTALYTPPGAPGAVRDARLPRQCWDLDTILPMLDPNYPLPEFRGARTCYFCEVLKGKTLIPWTPDTPRPSPESNQKFGHDPWHCPEVGRELKRLQANGDTRFTDALVNGVVGKPATRNDFPTRERA